MEYKQDMYRMFERPTLCPYTEVCESFQTICRAERWTEQALVKLWRERDLCLPPSDNGYSIHTLQWRLNHMRLVKERCYNHCDSCLRFRQFKARQEEEPHSTVVALPGPPRDRPWSPYM